MLTTSDAGEHGKAQAKALSGAGVLASILADNETARELSENSLMLYKTLGDQRGTGRARLNFGNTVRRTRDYKRAEEEFSEASRRWRDLGYEIVIAEADKDLGHRGFDIKNYRQACRL